MRLLPTYFPNFKGCKFFPDFQLQEGKKKKVNCSDPLKDQCRLANMYTHKHARTEHLAIIFLRGSNFSSRIWRARLLGPGVLSRLGAIPLMLSGSTSFRPTCISSSVANL